MLVISAQKQCGCLITKTLQKVVILHHSHPMRPTSELLMGDRNVFKTILNLIL